MFDKIVYESLHFLMKYAGKINSWAWRKHVKIIEDKRQKEHEEYVKELTKVRQSCIDAIKVTETFPDNEDMPKNLVPKFMAAFRSISSILLDVIDGAIAKSEGLEVGKKEEKENVVNITTYSKWRKDSKNRNN